MIEVYHITGYNKWVDISTPSLNGKDNTGIKPFTKVCKQFEGVPQEFQRAVFSLLDPVPVGWIFNQAYPQAWRILRRDIAPLVLNVQLDEELVAKSFVLDNAPNERAKGGHVNDMIQSGLTNTPFSSTLEGRLEAERQYWESRVPLADVVDDPTLIDCFELPEVITAARIPLTQIELAPEQPWVKVESQADEEYLAYMVREYACMEPLARFLD